MSDEGSDDIEDDVLAQLNQELEDEKRQKKVDAEVKKRRGGEKPEEEEEEKKPARKAQFKTREGKTREIGKKKKDSKPKCHHCGSEDTTRLDDGNTIIRYRNKAFDGILAQVRRCNDCGKRFGVAK